MMIEKIANHTPENQYHWLRLLGSIEASYGGLNLLMCICDNPYYRDEIIEAYETALSAKGVSCHRVQIDRGYPSLKQHLLDLEASSDIKQPAIVTVFGIDRLCNVKREQTISFSQKVSRSAQDRF